MNYKNIFDRALSIFLILSIGSTSIAPLASALAADSESLHGEDQANLPSYAQKEHRLKLLLDDLKSQNGSIGQSSYLWRALGSYDRQEEAKGDLAVALYLESIQHLTGDLFKGGLSSGQRRGYIEYIEQSHPNTLNSLMREIIESMKASTSQLLKKAVTAETFRDRTHLALSPVRNRSLERGVIEMNAALSELQTYLSSAPPARVADFFVHKGVFLSRYRDFLEALLQRYYSVEERATEMQKLVAGFKIHGRFTTGTSEGDVALFANTSERDRHEDSLRIYVNTETVTATASGIGLATAILAETIAIPETGGATAAAIPTTLAAIQYTTNAILVVNSGANVLDRYSIGGWKGLENIETLFDVLTIVSLSPRISVAWRAGGNGFVRAIDMIHKGAGYALLVAIPGYGIYQIRNAEAISAKTGIPANQIRMQGITSIAVGLLGGMTAYHHKINEIQAGGPHVESEVKEIKKEVAAADNQSESTDFRHETPALIEEHSGSIPENSGHATRVPADPSSSQDLDRYEAKVVKMVRTRGDAKIEREVQVLTETGQAQMLMDLEAQALTLRRTQGLSMEDAQELQGLIRQNGSEWLHENYHTYRKAGSSLETVLSDMTDELLVKASKTRGIPWTQAMIEKLQIFAPRNIPRLLMKTGGNVGKFAVGQIKQMLIMGTLLGIWNSYFSPIQGTIFNFAAQKGSQNLGNSASRLQMWLSRLDQSKAAAKDFKGANDDLKKYDFDHMSSEKAKKLWSSYEEKFQAISIRSQQALPATLRDGRGIFRDFVLNQPIALANSLSTSELQYSFHKKSREELLTKLSGAAPNGEQKQSLQYDTDMMNVGESAIAATLAAWKIMGFLYPELARDGASEENRRLFSSGYNTFTRSMHFELYLKNFTQEMDQALEALDIDLKNMETDLGEQSRVLAAHR